MPAAACQLATTHQLGRDPREVSRARRIVRTTLSDWQLTEHSEMAELIVSEIATNAIRHGSGPVRLTLVRTADAMRIEIHDDSPLLPARQHASTIDEGGRGLDLIDALIAMHRGTCDTVLDDHGPGKTMIVSLPVPLQPEPAPVATRHDSTTAAETSIH